MKKRILMILTSLAGTMLLTADDCIYTECCTDCFGFDSVLTYDIGGGYRQDTLQWKSYPDNSPDTVIHEKWKDVEMGVVETDVQFLACEHYLLKVNFDYAMFDRSGHQKVTTENTLTDTLTQYVQAHSKGRAYDISGSIGYQFNWGCYRYSFAPLVGYSYHFQKFKDHKYTNELNDADNEIFTHNRYKYRWRGPTLGFATAYQICCDWQVAFSYVYHWVRYRGTVQENFFAGQLPQHQKANRGHGNEFILSTTYEFCENWLFAMKVDYKVFDGDKGHSVLDDEDSSGSSAADARLKDIHWDSFTATIDVAYVF